MGKIYISKNHLVKACVIALIILAGVVWQYTSKENEVIEWEEVESLSDSARGAGGFGSTGVK